MDVVTPLMQTLKAQADIDHTRAVTADTGALAQQRMLGVLLNQQQMARDDRARELYKSSQFDNPTAPAGGAGPQGGVLSNYDYDSPLIQSLKNAQEGVDENRKLLKIAQITGDLKMGERARNQLDNMQKEFRLAQMDVTKDDERRNKEAAQVFGEAKTPEQVADGLKYVAENLGQRQAKKLEQQLMRALPGGLDNATPEQIESALKPIVNQYNARGNVLRFNASALSSAASVERTQEIKRHNLETEAAVARRQAGVPKSAVAEGGATGGDGSFVSDAPGGAGSVNYVDPNTGERYLQNKTGATFKVNEDGKYQSINPNDMPKNVMRAGAIGTAGSRESTFNQRIILAGNQAAKDLANVVELPTTVSTGFFGGRKQGPGLLSAAKEVLANTVTGQEAQLYNSMATGFQRSLAAIESAGLMPSGQLTHQMDAVMLKEGDTNLTKLSKLAQVRQIVEAGMEVLVVNPRVSDAEKEKAQDIINNVRKAVPYTQKDIIKLHQSEDDAVTLRDIIKTDKKEEKAVREQGKTEADPILLGGGGGNVETQFNALPSGYYFKGPDGKTRRKP